VATGLAPGLAAQLLAAAARGTSFTAPSAWYVQLHTGDPGAAGTSNTAAETSRQQAVFDAVVTSTGTVTVASTSDVSWSAVAAPGGQTLTRFSVWSASTSGTFLWSGTLTSVAVVDGAPLRIPAGQLTAAHSTAS
jgi:hypothetical protein